MLQFVHTYRNAMYLHNIIVIFIMFLWIKFDYNMCYT